MRAPRGLAQAQQPLRGGLGLGAAAGRAGAVFEIGDPRHQRRLAKQTGERAQRRRSLSARTSACATLPEPAERDHAPRHGVANFVHARPDRRLDSCRHSRHRETVSSRSKSAPCANTLRSLRNHELGNADAVLWFRTRHLTVFEQAFQGAREVDRASFCRINGYALGLSGSVAGQYQHLRLRRQGGLATATSEGTGAISTSHSLRTRSRKRLSVKLLK